MKIRKINPNAPTPVYATPGSACFDLTSVYETTIEQGDSAAICTGLSFEIPDGFVMLIFSRSGHGFEHGIRLANSVGIIDSDYRGEVKIKLHNDSIFDFIVHAGTRIAQAMVIPVVQQTFEVVDKITTTYRGDKGFGSTG